MNRREHVGVFTTDKQLVVQSWNSWMADATGLAESAACGEPITRLVPDIASRGLLSRLRRVADGAGVEVLAPAFHKYLIPCAPRDPTSRFERMRQHVTIAPLRDRDGIAGLIVTIEDVTARFDRDLQLTTDLDSRDEAVRLRAAETLAAGGAAPSVLAGALTDDSWRVRRVAAEGLAANGGREAVEKLVEALRHHHRDLALLNATLTALSKTREDVVSTVANFLTDDDAEVRTYAALALGLIGDARPVPALIERLDDVDMNVRFHAIEALGRIRDPDAVGVLMAVAASRDFFLSFAALEALAAIGDSSVVPQLFELLDEESLILAVVSCLGALATEEAAIPLAALMQRSGAPIAAIASALADIHGRVQRQLGEGALVADLTRGVITEDVAARIIDATSRANETELLGLLVVLSWLPFARVDETLTRFVAHPGVGRITAQLLAARGVDTAAAVERAVENESDDVKRVAAGVLGRIGSRASVATLVRWLQAERDVAIAAATALGAIGDPRAFEHLLPLLDHPEASIRQAAVAALNSIGHPRMEEAIAARLKSESPRERESAARVAGYFGYRSCLRRLVELCDDDDALVRRTAVEHIANFDERQAWSKIRELLTTDTSPSVRAAAARALGAATTDAVLPALLAATNDSNLWVRYYAIRSIAAHATTHADALTRLAECATRDPAPPVRIAAIEALAAAGSTSMARALVPLIHDPEPEVACAAAVALGSIATVESTTALHTALSDHDPAMQRAALEALGKRRTGPVKEIAELARRSHDGRVQEQALRTLAEIGGTSAIVALLDLAGDRQLREVATTVLVEIAGANVPILGAQLSLAGERSRRLIVDVLSCTRNPAATPILAGALSDSSPSVRLAAARALSRFDLHEARGQLSVLARTDENPAVRTAARNALASG